MPTVMINVGKVIVPAGPDQKSCGRLKLRDTAHSLRCGRGKNPNEAKLRCSFNDRPLKRLGVMGGAFNPIHFGHLFAAEAARAKFSLDKVLFMPTGRLPKEKPIDQVSVEDRYAMTVIATAANPFFAVSRLEVDRPGPSYTIDTLRQLHKEYGPDTKLFFITGADAVLDIFTWKDAETMAGYCEFIAATRPGYDLERFNELIKVGPNLPSVHIMEIPALAISSTDLRRRIKSGEPFRYLLPAGVVGYIYKAGLYM